MNSGCIGACDAAGNMTTIPQPDDAADDYTLSYDAWNRLVEVTDGETTIAKYEYDRLGRRVKKHYDSGGAAGIDKYVHYFYDGVQVVETRETTTESDEPEDLDPQYQYVWSARYIDAPTLRDEYDEGTLSPDDRLYYLTDTGGTVDLAGVIVLRRLTVSQDRRCCSATRGIHRGLSCRHEPAICARAEPLLSLRDPGDFPNQPTPMATPIPENRRGHPRTSPARWIVLCGKVSGLPAH